MALPACDPGLSESFLLIPPCRTDNAYAGFSVSPKIGARIIEITQKLTKIEDLT